MNTTTLTNPAAIEFARAVRSALADLPPDEVEELTDGLEADLEEQSRDSEDFTFGDPAAYAHELRLAAGYPEATRTVWRPIASLASWWTQVRSDVALRIRSHPRTSRTLDFVTSLRAVWWVLRGWALYKLGSAILGGGQWAPFPRSVTGALFLGLLLLLSIQWGRGKWAPRAWLRLLRAVASIVAIVLIPVYLGQVGSYSASAVNIAVDESSFSPQGLQLDGATVSNIFAYDAKGQPLSNVQLFDQDGKPLNAVSDPSTTPWIAQPDGENVLVPNESVPGRVGWNVYPLGQLPNSMVGDQTSSTRGYDPSLIPNPAKAPFSQVSPLAGQ